MGSGITAQHPSTKLTVGAQYIAFNTMAADGTWQNTFDTTIYKLPTVVDVEIKDSNDSYDSYASGETYESDTQTSYKEISETNLAFPEELLAKMNGDTVTDGVILENGMKTRPYFAYGMVVKKKDETLDLRWYPKCKKTDNSDKTATSEDKHKDQTDTITRREFLERQIYKYNKTFKDNAEKWGGKEEAVYELVYEDLDKPLITRNIPYLASHLSLIDGFLGLAVVLNDNEEYAFRITYSKAALDDEKIWAALTKAKWTIKSKEGEISEVDPKFTFEKKGATIDVKPATTEVTTKKSK